ncbi:NAD(P)H-binding protein [Lactococcus lactis]|uniref:NAD(P)H-binding protein n=1 Tax=Lactococcus lactis TaxID=1358 RepID=UPI001913BBFC|nr:NAD(P)H-binding protein [Lactococcus lactis]MBK5076988.1 NAD(P)H-binding protein [Lactococcus lactis]WDA70052.1 NAD(P)H-binding protein [Lactococcus lactis]
MKNVLIIGAGGQIPEVLIPLLQEQANLKLTLFGRNAEDLPYDNATKLSGDASNLSDVENAMKGQDIVYMNFDNKAVTEVVIKAMDKMGVKRIIQAGVLSVYGEVAEPFATWNSRMMGGRVAHNRGIEALETSDLDYTYMRMTWLYNAQKKDYVASPKGEPFLGAQISRRAIAQFVCDNITGKRNDIRTSIGLWEPGSENKAKPDFY